MSTVEFIPAGRESRWPHLAVLLAAAGIALVSALPYAGGWNDGSRLATIESLVDFHTWKIDRSCFVQVPQPLHPSDPTPYRATDAGVMRSGTLDKLMVDGDFYSDKPPVLAVYQAGLYEVWQWLGGSTARLRPDLFCLLMTVVTSGLSYVVAVYCTYRLGCVFGLALPLRLGMAASMALGTFALAYTRHTNGHIVFLGASAALFLELAYLARASWGRDLSWWRFAYLGTLAGICYTIDLGVGPVLVACLAPLVVWRCRRVGPVLVFGSAALPWFLAHHCICYSIAGSFGPMSSDPRVFLWPGSPFNSTNMTGICNHTLASFPPYALSMIAGKKGLLGHNLPMFLSIVAVVILVRDRVEELPEVLFAAGWAVGTWLLYAALSNNSSGQCCSIRWFVPLLAPGFFALALLFRDRPSYRWDFYLLSLWGAVLGIMMWSYGPWLPHMVPFFWPIQATALLSWAVCRAWCRRLGGIALAPCLSPA